jgi:hypothetical protein
MAIRIRKRLGLFLGALYDDDDGGGGGDDSVMM